MTFAAQMSAFDPKQTSAPSSVPVLAATQTEYMSVSTGLRALTQSGENFQAGIAIDGLHTDLFLIGENGFDSVASGAPVYAVGLEALLVEPALDLFYFLECRRAFPAWKLLAERRVATNEVPEMTERERVAGGRIVRMHRTEVLSHEKGRAAGDRQPQFHLVAGTGESCAVGSAHAEVLPLGI